MTSTMARSHVRERAAAAAPAIRLAPTATSRPSVDQALGERPAKRAIVFDEQHARHQTRLRQLDADGRSPRADPRSSESAPVHLLQQPAADEQPDARCRSCRRPHERLVEPVDGSAVDTPAVVGHDDLDTRPMSSGCTSTVTRARRHARPRSAADCGSRVDARRSARRGASPVRST